MKPNKIGLIILLIFMIYCILRFANCDSVTDPEPVYINLEFDLKNLDGSITTLSIKDTIYADSNRIYYSPDPVQVLFDSANIVYTPGPVVHDTTWQVPEINTNSVMITWNHQDSLECKFRVNMQGQDTTIVIDPGLVYYPADPDTFGIRYEIPLMVGRYVENGKTWQVLQFWVEAVTNGGIYSPPSKPVIIKHFEEVTNE